MQRRSFLKSCAAALALTAPDSQAADTAGAVSLEEAFRNPPQWARPKTWWHWMNGNITAEGITLDLEAMKQIGLAGFQCFNVGSRTPKGPVEYFSPEWFRLTEHAIRETDRLGLDFGMHNCPGWSSSAGPWITPELSMQQLVWSEAFVSGGKTIDLTLPQPYSKLDYYRDAMVVAFPSLEGETHSLASRIRAVTSNSGSIDPNVLTDGDLSKGVELRSSVPGQPIVVQMEFAEPFEARAIAVYGIGLARIMIDGSEDGAQFHQIAVLTAPSTANMPDIPGTATFSAVRVKYLRLSLRQPGRLCHVRVSSAGRIPEWQRKNNSATYAGHEPSAEHAIESSTGSIINRASVIDLSRHMDAHGRLQWDAPAGNWTILRLGHTPTGRHNSSPPDGGQGLDCDKYTRAGIDFHFNYVFSRLLPSLRPLVAKHMAGTLIDSYEVGMQNWTRDFPQEFERRRGYSLLPYMPAMTGRVTSSPEESERFLWDVRRVQADLMAENYYGRFTELCREHGLLSSAEPYSGGPFDEMQSGSVVDVPMGEFWQASGTHRSVKLAASVGHIYGRREIAAESFTGNPQYAKWQGHPYGFKAQGDWMYTQGLNRFIFHRYAMQPHPTAVPGMTMGCYGIHFDRTNTWFPLAGPWIEYLSRCQYLLQQGVFMGDLLYFEGEDAPVEAPVRRALQPAPPLGYDWDTVDAGAILNRIRVENGRIVLPDGLSYRVMILRDDARLSLDLLRKIRDLVHEGMCLVGAKPAGSAGLAGYPRTETEAQDILSELWSGLDGKTVTEHAAGKGRVFWGAPLNVVLNQQGIEPDFEATSRSGDAQIHYIHRRVPDGEVYFVANRKRRAEDLVCTFRVTGKQPEFWDPATGAITPVHFHEPAGKRTRVPVHLDPAGSVFVVFRFAAEPRRVTEVTKDGASIVQTKPFPIPAAAPHRGVTNNFTICVWVKPELDTPLEALGRGPIASPASYVFFPPEGDAVYGEGHASCGLIAGRNGIGIYERSRAGVRPALVAEMPIAGWTHLAVVYKDGMPSVYVNGKFVRQGRRSANVVHPGTGEPNLGYEVPNFNGDLTDPELFPEALDPERIQRAASAGVPKPAEPPAVEPAVDGSGDWLIWQNGRYRLHGAGDHNSEMPVTGIGQPIDVAGPWQVTFPPKRGAPESVTLPELISLHKHTDPGVRYFSGTATYSKALSIPALAKGQQRLYLDLGRVEVIAEVHLNGRDLGILWKPPHRVDVTGAVRAGRNQLEIRVTNLWPNRLIGDEFLPPENEYRETGTNIKDIGEIKQIPEWFLEGKPKPGKRITFSTWRHYYKDSPLLESGLLGPVQLRSAVRRPISV
ncbi:MAG TPA: glycosyl hydrolase [Bryobacteraceae bacterium]|nr:glycosyl hydrolase [Bryobacteraceae bacterium]